MLTNLQALYRSSKVEFETLRPKKWFFLQERDSAPAGPKIVLVPPRFMFTCLSALGR